MYHIHPLSSIHNSFFLYTHTLWKAEIRKLKLKNTVESFASINIYNIQKKKKSILYITYTNHLVKLSVKQSWHCTERKQDKELPM